MHKYPKLSLLAASLSVAFSLSACTATPKQAETLQHAYDANAAVRTVSAVRLEIKAAPIAEAVKVLGVTDKTRIVLDSAKALSAAKIDTGVDDLARARLVAIIDLSDTSGK